MADQNTIQKPAKKGLGRGLSALMENRETSYDQIAENKSHEEANVSTEKKVPIEFLFTNTYQPRIYFDDKKALELVESVRTKGILQPILVRPKGPDHYEIIAGERRWRAAQAAGFHEVPVIVKNFSNVEALEVALIENIQRHDLNAIEEALGYKRLIEEFSHTQNEVSKMIGKSRSHIANILRLLSLPLSVQQLMREEKISMGHARALITAEDPETLARLVISQGLSVRQIEKMATSKSSTGSGSSSHSVTGKSGKDVDILALENELSSTIGLKITLDPQGAEQGILKIHYKSLDQLDDICSRLNKVPNN